MTLHCSNFLSFKHGIAYEENNLVGDSEDAKSSFIYASLW